MNLLNVAQFFLSLFLAWSCFCRIRKTDSTTVDPIRHAFALQATVMVFVCVRSLWGDADPVLVLALLGTATVQAATAVYWPADGVPSHFIKRQARGLRRRRSTDFERSKA